MRGFAIVIVPADHLTRAFIARPRLAELIEIKTGSASTLRSRGGAIDLYQGATPPSAYPDDAKPEAPRFSVARKRIQMFALAQGKTNQSPLQSMLAWCRARFKKVSEPDFGCCDQAEIERMARDIRMSASELRALAGKGPKAADLLLRRMAELDLDPKEVAWLEPAVARDLQRVCSMCKSQRRCAWDFARRAPPSARKSYCPNTGTLDALNGMPWTTRREW